MGTETGVTTGRSAKALWRLKFMFWLDATLLASVAALQTVRFTGLVLHEWLGLVVVPLIFLHLLLAWSWIAVESGRFFTSQTVRGRINYLLNLGLFAAVTSAVYSGILISQRAIPVITRTKAGAEVDWKWDKLHNEFADIVVILVGLHLAINWEWVLAAGQKIFSRRVRGKR